MFLFSREPEYTGGMGGGEADTKHLEKTWTASAFSGGRVQRTYALGADR